jgi:hypothetical protein
MSESTTSLTRYVDKETAVEETFRPEWARVQEAAQRIGIKSSRFYKLLDESNGAIRTCILKSPRCRKGPETHIPPISICLLRQGRGRASASSGAMKQSTNESLYLNTLTY